MLMEDEPHAISPDSGEADERFRQTWAVLPGPSVPAADRWPWTDAHVAMLVAYAALPEKTFARNLRQLRELNGWTQKAVADAMALMGFSMMQTTVAKIEANQRPIRLNEAVGLCDIFGTARLLDGVLGSTVADSGVLRSLTMKLGAERYMVKELRELEREHREQVRKWLTDHLEALDEADKEN